MMQRTNERKRNLREPHRILPLNAVWQKARLLVAAAGFALLGWTATAATDSVILAGGCFWCVESDFDSVTGVTATTSGYTGGTSSNPSYKSVSAGRGGHYEAVKVEFDPAQVSLRTLLDKFWRSIDALMMAANSVTAVTVIELPSLCRMTNSANKPQHQRPQRRKCLESRL